MLTLLKNSDQLHQMRHYTNGLTVKRNSEPTETVVSSYKPSCSMKIASVHRDKETMYLNLSRECVVHSVICVLYIVIGVKDVIPRRPRCFTETNIERKNKQLWAVSFFVLRNITVINYRSKIVGKRAWWNRHSWVGHEWSWNKLSTSSGNTSRGKVIWCYREKSPKLKSPPIMFVMA